LAFVSKQATIYPGFKSFMALNNVSKKPYTAPVSCPELFAKGGNA
jgi:hypothetical protein